MSRIAFLLMTVCVARVAAQNAPWKAPSLRIVDSIRIDVNKEQVGGVTAMALRADGSIAVIGRGSTLAYFDSLGRRRWVRNLRPDVRMADALSWKGDSVVVIDNVTDQVLAVGSNGGVGDILDFPDYVRPPWKDRRTMPAYGAFDVVAALADGSLVGTPRRPHSLALYGSTVKPDAMRVPVVRVDLDGIVQTRLATITGGPKGDVWSLQSDGRLFFFRAERDSLSFIGIGSRGDTLFQRRLPRVRAVFGSIGGPDGTIWVSYSLGGYEYIHSAFDAKGVEIGRVTLPNSVRVGAGDARHVWLYETKGYGKSIKRYTLRP